jgi:cytochrome c oxidase cbb3-type subunit 3
MIDTKAKTQSAVQTTGHAWDGDLQEFNNPLPSWWLWGFYATVVFAVLYWVLFPAWPVAGSFTKGVMNTITFIDSSGEERTTHWNTRSLLLKDLQESESAQRSREYLEKVTAADYQQILSDPEMMDFTRSLAKGLFGDNCAACHGAGGTGVTGLFPNLADDDWLWGGTVEQIEATIRAGRYGFMPAFRASFNQQQLDDLATYVLSLSGHEVEQDAAARGQTIFQTDAGGCYYCHTSSGTGLQSQGAANLTDQVWTVAAVDRVQTIEERKAAVKRVISNGVERRMPDWSVRLQPEQIKLLTVYVHELGGGQ